VVDLCGFEELGDGAARRFDVGSTSIAVVRIGEEVFAIGDRCTHADVSLSEGEVDADDCTLECWKHGSQFDLRTGEPLSLPATKPTPVYEAKVVDGRVQVEVDGS
jgi:3-phenylpropionate/trans-cinnamate dioxygenase ferredoxin subunit